MQRPIKPEWLLRQADELGYRGAIAGQPRNANLRRAVSSAYYALFHHIVLALANHSLPHCSTDDQYRFARHVQHRAVRRVCDQVVGPKQPPPKVRMAILAVRADTTLNDVSLAFQTLQEARHRADYDHLASHNKAETLTLIDQARDAITKINASTGTPLFEVWLMHMILNLKDDG